MLKAVRDFKQVGFSRKEAEVLTSKLTEVIEDQISYQTLSEFVSG